MSASEKLKAWQESPRWFDRRIALENALPQIVAVVEAAEEIVAYTAGEWREREVPRISALSVPLAALEEELA